MITMGPKTMRCVVRVEYWGSSSLLMVGKCEGADSDTQKHRIDTILSNRSFALEQKHEASRVGILNAFRSVRMRSE